MKYIYITGITFLCFSVGGMDMPKVHSETQRLILREWSASDAEELLRIHQDCCAMQYSSGLLSREQTLERLRARQEHFKNHGFGACAIVLKATNELIGFGGFAVFPGKEYPLANTTEALIRLHHDYWKKGYATEAAQALLRKAFTDYKLTNIVASVNPNNIHSIKLIEKFGFTRDKNKDFYRPEASIKIPESFYHFYSINKEEWEKVKREEDLT